MLPSATDLRFFLEIARRQNLTRAAERLGVRQPSLSESLQRLEKQLGAQLVNRSRKGVTPTRAGEELARRAEELLEKWEAITRVAQAEMQEVTGLVTVGCHPAVGAYVLPTFMREFLPKYPRLQVRIVSDLSRKVTEEVIRGTVDVGLVVNPIRHPDLVLHPWGKDEFTLFAPTFWKGKRLEDLREQTLFLNPDLNQAEDILSRLRKARIEFARIVPCASLELIATLTREGSGMGVLPARVAAAIGGGKLVPVIGAPKYPDEIAIVHRAEARHVRAIREVVAALKRKDAE
jgi:DNA-binding transcriptional LysR family regulator